jgi:hypothetical protein
MEYSVYHRYRFNDKISLTHNASIRPFKNDVGFYSTQGTRSTLSLRDRNVVENGLEAKYSFNNKSGISFIARHYWSEVKNKELYNLEDDGNLKFTAPPAAGIEHRNYNNFYINMVYTWQFAPGSFLNVVWKDESEVNDTDIQYRYFKNFDRTLGSPQNNNLSFKLIFYLDYLDFKKWGKKKDRKALPIDETTSLLQHNYMGRMNGQYGTRSIY